MQQPNYAAVMPERDIITGAWYIIKNHAEIWSRTPGNDTDQEWASVCSELIELSQRGDTAPRRALANGIAHAISSYYEAGQQQ